MKIAALEVDRTRAWTWALALAATPVLGLVLAFRPWLAAGALLGAGAVAATLYRPLIVIGAMLAIGPLDLALLTGGEKKGLLEGLGGIDMNGIRLLAVIAGLAAVVLTDRRVLKAATGPRARWYFLFLAYAGATLALSGSLLHGARLLAKMAYPALFFVTVLGVARNREELDRLVDWTLIGAAVICVAINPVLAALGGYEINQTGHIRIQGAGVHENPFSFWLVMMLLVAVARFDARRQWRYLVLGVIFVGWLAATRTRISFAALLAALTAVALYAGVVYRDRRILAGTALIGGLVLYLLYPVVMERTLGYVPGVGELWALVQDPSTLYRRVNWSGRDVFWPVLFAAFLGNPVLGQGLGSSTRLMRETFPMEWAGVAHNEYLRLAVDTGVIGLGLYAFAMWRWLVGALKAGVRGGEPVREFALPAIGGILALAIVSITDNTFDYYAAFTQYVGFFAAAVLVAAREAGGEAGPGEVPAA